MPKVVPINRENGEVGLWMFWCPGCEENHAFVAGRWQFNGDVDNPTFSPSLLYPKKEIRCHLFVRNGQIEYCSDCDHELAGQTIDVPEYPW